MSPQMIRVRAMVSGLESRAMKITACLIVLNEQDRITEAVRGAVGICDEVLVVDGGSWDDTVSLAKAAGARVIERPFEDFAPQKNFANEQAGCPWILSLDADERISSDLATEIGDLRRAGVPEDVAAFAFPRHAYYLGRRIRHSWSDDVKPRLFRAGRARWEGDWVHESLIIDGRVERLKGPLLHYTYRDISDHAKRIDFYSTRAAEKMRAGRHIPTLSKMTILPFWTFFRFFIFKLGFLDGWPGFVIAAMSSYSVLLKYLKLRELLVGDAAQPPARS